MEVEDLIKSEFGHYENRLVLCFFKQQTYSFQYKARFANESMQIFAGNSVTKPYETTNSLELQPSRPAPFVAMLFTCFLSHSEA